MNAWLDGYLLPLLLGIPVGGMAFVAVMPASDRVSLRHAGLGISTLTALLAFYAALFSLSSTAPSLPSLFTSWGGLLTGGLQFTVTPLRAGLLVVVTAMSPMILRAAAPRVMERTKGYVLLHLLFLALVVSALLAQHAIVSLALLNAALLPLLLLLGLFGGNAKGSALLRVGMSWLIVDALAFAALIWPLSRARSGELGALKDAARAQSAEVQRFLFLALGLAAALRLAIVPTSGWVVSFLREAPLSAAALTAVGVMPVGGLLFLELGLQLLPSAATTFAPMLLWVGATTSFLGGCMALVDRDLRALLAGAALVHGGLALLGLSCLDTKAAVAAILYLVSVSASLAVALFCVDALERRYLTRDSVELFGVLEELPGLWRIVVLSFGSLLAVPMLGGGALAFEVARGVLSTRAFAVAGLPSTLSFLVLLVSGLGATLLAAGVVTVVRRLSSPHARPEVRTRAAFSTSQSLRLWIALVFVWSGSLLAPWLLPSLTEQVERGTIAIEAGDRHVVAEPEARR